jgi:hypothetical protein
MGGAHLYGFSAADFEKADAAAGGMRAATNGGPDAASAKGKEVTVGG